MEYFCCDNDTELAGAALEAIELVSFHCEIGSDRSLGDGVSPNSACATSVGNVNDDVWSRRTTSNGCL